MCVVKLMQGVINGLDLFSGIGGITIALQKWVRPVAYCEIDRYCQSVLLSRMSEGQLPIAPIWDNIETLEGKMLPKIDIIYGGFPCQDISVANVDGKGLEGNRSGLFFQIMRLAKEIKPRFIFLENVPNIRTRGLNIVGKELAKTGYDCRWYTLSAKEVGANHKRERWFLLANSNIKTGYGEQFETKRLSSRGICTSVSNTQGKRLEGQCKSIGVQKTNTNNSINSWWEVEPNVGRVVDGLPFRVDRIKGLGNSVVPLQAKTAFETLMGLKN